MLVTPDVIGAILAVFGAAASVLAGVWAMNGRMLKSIDARFDRVDARMDRLEARMDRVENELVEVKIAIARIEGPRPGLLRP